MVALWVGLTRGITAQPAASTPAPLPIEQMDADYTGDHVLVQTEVGEYAWSDALMSDLYVIPISAEDRILIDESWAKFCGRNIADRCAWHRAVESKMTVPEYLESLRVAR